MSTLTLQLKCITELELLTHQLKSCSTPGYPCLFNMRAKVAIFRRIHEYQICLFPDYWKQNEMWKIEQKYSKESLAFALYMPQKLCDAQGTIFARKKIAKWEKVKMSKGCSFWSEKQHWIDSITNTAKAFLEICWKFLNRICSRRHRYFKNLMW